MTPVWYRSTVAQVRKMYKYCSSCDVKAWQRHLEMKTAAVPTDAWTPGWCGFVAAEQGAWLPILDRIRASGERAPCLARAHYVTRALQQVGMIHHLVLLKQSFGWRVSPVTGLAHDRVWMYVHTAPRMRLDGATSTVMGCLSCPARQPVW